MQLQLPEFCLVLLVGPSSSGKSSFARTHFKPTEVISSDACRAWVSDDENSLEATADAFDLARYMAAKRLKNRLLTVIDATNIQPDSRSMWLKLAREYHTHCYAIAFNMPLPVLLERHSKRSDRNFGEHVIPNQQAQLKRTLRLLRKEGFKNSFIFNSPEEVKDVQQVTRTRVWNNMKHEHGPFDIIGDVHGCFDELQTLLQQLGYGVETVPVDDVHHGYRVIPPAGRRLIFVGDLCDRGPKTPDVFRLVMSMVHDGVAFCVPGNHDEKLMKYFNGNAVKLQHGLERSVEQFAAETDVFKAQVKKFIDSLISHLIFDDGKLLVAHAGLKEELQGRTSGAVRSFCLFGETTGETDEFGLPVRHNWALEYRGKAMVVYGHTPVPHAQWLNNTIDIDTGCVFGGKLTALRYPEKELVQVPALMQYAVPRKPIGSEFNTGLNAQQEHDDTPDIADLLGKQIITTQYANNVIIREEQATAALEVMSRFAVNPKWLIYLPPTMSPSETSSLPEYLEHPAEAFAYFRSQGVQQVICEEKHMGSRAVVVIGKNEKVITERFGISGEGIGVIYTRTGRAFFADDKTTEQAFLKRLCEALTASEFWETHETDWVCLDCELMPWSAKAQKLLEEQYAATGTAATHSLSSAVKALEQTKARLPEAAALLQSYTERETLLHDYIRAYRNYCWEVNSLDDYKLAPFHILASEGKTYFDKDHRWHMEAIKTVCEADPNLLLATPYRVVDLDNETEVNAAAAWWTAMTGKGGEGMVVKPLAFVVRSEKGLVQPAIKIRGREYLRIIYGPEYTREIHLTRLKKRGLSHKRSMALREFALGAEALERFIQKQPLRMVHQCVFGVLALESEPVDPRL